MFTVTKPSYAATAIIRLLSTSRLSSRYNHFFRSPKLQPLSVATSSRFAVRSLHSSTTWRRQAATAEAEIEEEDELLADKGQAAQRVDKRPAASGAITHFAELKDRGLVCATVVDTLTKDMGLTTMTEVQSRTINETLKGIDV